MRITSLLFVTFFVVGCSLLGGEEDEIIEREGPLLPLEVGNIWTYERSEEASYTNTLATTEELHGQTYYQLLIDYGEAQETGQFVRDSLENGRRVGTIFLYRVERSNGDVYQESNFFKYPAQDGDTYEYTDVRGLSFTYEVEREIVQTPEGRFRAYTYSGYDADPEVSISFAPGIGPVRLTESGGETVLTDYDVGE